jgi:diaminopimelate decarboxylase
LTGIIDTDNAIGSRNGLLGGDDLALTLFELDDHTVRGLDCHIGGGKLDVEALRRDLTRIVDTHNAIGSRNGLFGGDNLALALFKLDDHAVRGLHSHIGGGELDVKALRGNLARIIDTDNAIGSRNGLLGRNDLSTLTLVGSDGLEVGNSTGLMLLSRVST